LHYRMPRKSINTAPCKSVKTMLCKSINAGAAQERPDDATQEHQYRCYARASIPPRRGRECPPRAGLIPLRSCRSIVRYQR
ncbi:hypothetical protein K523DRAFT_235193, partial [Schizophyllum commune Tattone D]